MQPDVDYRFKITTQHANGADSLLAADAALPRPCGADGRSTAQRWAGEVAIQHCARDDMKAGSLPLVSRRSCAVFHDRSTMMAARRDTFGAGLDGALAIRAIALCFTLCACTEAPRPTAGPPPQVASSPWAMAQEASKLEAAARALLPQHETDEALRLAYRALEIRRRTLGDAHVDTWRTAELIADIHLQASQLDQAEVALQFDLAARERALGAMNVDLAKPLGQLADIAVKRRDYSLAEQLRRRVLSLLETGLGPWHPDVATAGVRLAVLLDDLCRGGEARALLERALEIQGRAFGPTSTALAQTWEDLSHAQWISNDDTGGESSLQKAVSLLSPHESERAEALMGALGRLAMMYGERHLSAEALAAGERAVTIGERSPGISANARVGLAASLWPVIRTAASPEAADKLLVRLSVARIERTRPGVVTPAPASPAAPRCSPPSSTPATGGGSVANAFTVVTGHAAGFRRCYNEALKIDADLHGSFRITARIGPSGEVSSAFTYVPVGSMARVGECVVDAVFLQSTFSPPEGGGATIVIPVTFVTQ